MKLKLLYSLNILASLCLLTITAFSQTSQTQYFVPLQFPRSPTATALEKYGTYQVNEFTGVPDISIPLYTIVAGGLKVPITLSYHASGIKVTEVSSWVGLGWSVSSGGQISRRVMGIPDDQAYGYLNGYMYPNTAINTSTEAGIDYLEYAATNVYDTKPDIYSYDFPGHGGKFFFDGSPGKNFAVRLIPFAPLKITRPTGGLSYINVADEHGNNYSFGGQAIDSTYSATGGARGLSNISAWKLTRMIGQNRRDTVSFTYNNLCKIDYPAADGEFYTIADNITTYNTGSPYSTNYNPTATTPGNINITNERLLSQINFKNGKVVFDLDTAKRQDVNMNEANNAHPLKDIKVYRYNYALKSMELQKTILFWTSYFNNSTGYTKRLRLDSIQVLDKAGSVIQHYRFDYNTSSNLPDYTSKMIDYWGYFNNKNNSQFTPHQTWTVQTPSGPTYITFGSNIINGRDCDSTYMQANVLTGIHYPSGGYTTFTYQSNQYYSGDTLKLAGGLRIKTISSYDGVNPVPVIKTYIYNSARKNFIFDYNYFQSTQEHRYFSSAQTTGVLWATCDVHTFSSMPHCDLEGYDCSTVVYPSVTEYIGSPGTNVGRTDYIFRDNPDGTLDASRSGSLIYLSHFYARGQLLSKKEYLRKSDGTYSPVRSVANAYSAFPITTYDAVGMNVTKLWYNEGAEGNPLFYPAGYSGDDKTAYQYPTYSIDSDDNYLTSTATTIYDTKDTTKSTSSTVTYTYDDTTHLQVRMTTHVDSKGNKHITVNKHPYDYLVGSTTGNAVLDSMVNRHMYGEVIEKWDSLRNATTSVNAVVNGQLNQFKYGYIPYTIVPSKISTLSVMQPLTNFTPSAVTSGYLTNDSRYVQMISFDQYDGQNNPIQYTPRNATPTSIIWNYQYELPIAQIKNATTVFSSLTQVAYTGFEGDNKGNWYYIGTPIFNPSAPSGSMVYSLNSGSISLNSSIDNTKSYVLSYWSNNGVATVYTGSYLTGTPKTTINGWTYYEYIVPSGTTGITISGTTTIDELRLYPTTAQMTTYAYDPNGVVDISDSKGLNTAFEYDFAQRLKNTRDFYGNITASYAYHMYDQTVGNQGQSGTFTRNNCPPNTTPGSLTFSVPANKYYSSTLASANADATYDLNTNGQIKANANCGCPQVMVSFTLSNSTGLSGFQATFSGVSTPYNFPSSGSTVIQVPQGSYATISVNAVGSGTHNFSLTGQVSQNGVHNASFSNISVTTGSNLTLSVQ